MIEMNNQNEEWFKAAKSGDFATIDQMMKSGMNLSIRDSSGHTAMSIAAKQREWKVVERIIKGNPSLVLNMILEWKNSGCKLRDESLLKWKNRIVMDVKDIDNIILVKAVEDQDDRIVELLIRAGADVNVKDGWGNSVLEKAVEGQNDRIVELLIRAGVNVNTRENSALMKAVEKYNWLRYVGDEYTYQGVLYRKQETILKLIKIMRLLINTGANFNMEEEFRVCSQALENAVKNEIEAMARLLLRMGASGSVLIDAAGAGIESMVKVFLDFGVNINIKSKDTTALMEAAKNGHERVVQMLINNGADVNVKGGCFNNTTLMEVIDTYKLDNDKRERIIKLLIRLGADVNAKDKKDRTALMKAVDIKSERIVRLLINNGANVNAKNEVGGTALMDTAIKGHEKIMQLLINNGADVDAQDKGGGTAIVKAAAYGHEKIVQLLINNGADVNADVLMYAAWNRRERIVRLLINNGSDAAAATKAIQAAVVLDIGK